MNRKRRLAAIVISTTLVALQQGGCTQRSDEPGPPTTQEGDDHPSTRSELLDFPDARRSIFAVLPPETKAAMWQDKLDEAVRYYQADETTVEIVQTLQKLQSILSVELFTDDNEDSLAEVQQLIEEAQEVLAPDELFCILRTLEDVEECLIGPASEGVPQRESAAAAAPGDCDCNSDSGDCCCHPTLCICEVCLSSICNWSSWGCGFLWLFECDGVCVAIVI